VAQPQPIHALVADCSYRKNLPLFQIAGGFFANRQNRCLYGCIMVCKQAILYSASTVRQGFPEPNRFLEIPNSKRCAAAGFCNSSNDPGYAAIFTVFL
jgi:hypothetical protein